MIIKAYKKSLYFPPDVSQDLGLTDQHKIKFFIQAYNAEEAVNTDVSCIIGDSGYKFNSLEGRSFSVMCQTLFTKGFLKPGKYKLQTEEKNRIKLIPVYE